MVIKNDGKVGIGTLSPLAKLSIDSGKIYFQGDDDYSSYGISFYHGGASTEKKILYYSGSTDKRTVIRGVNDGTISSSSTGGILFKNEADTDLMLLSSNGQVGIGTTTPLTNVKVSIVGNSGNTSNIAIRNTTATTTGFLYIQMNDDGKAYVLNSTNNPLIIGANNQGNHLYINNNGNIGIGNTNPSQKLDVSGNINLTGTISVSGTDLGLEHLSNASVSGNEITLGLTSTTGILPAQTGTVDLGSSSNKFDVLYASKLNNGVSFTLPTADGTSGQFLKTDGSGTLSWGTASGSGGASALNDLTDVSTSGAQTNYALVYNGSSWAPAAQSGSSSSSSEYYSAHIQNISDIGLYGGYTITDSENITTQYNASQAFTFESYNPSWTGMYSAAGKYNTTTGVYTGSASTEGVSGAWLQIDFGKK